ncbi:MAG: GxxExxY protein [Bacteroidales bacterium]|jgi:GxxExxY protein|nr:GxxExxY protein [Bacteroidales bacterium]
MTDVVYKELSYEVMAAVFEVYNTLGFGFLEKVYERALLKELCLRGIPVEAQKEIKVFYKGDEIGTYFADLVVNDEILLELKAVESLNNIHKAQVLNFLKATGFKLGLLINFGRERVQYERLVF